MAHAPPVSIIIPCFNADRFIGDAIQSALDQTYPRIEVIVIDDGSTDGSLDVLKSFGDRIRWESGPNRGACAARNRGLELSKGEFIQFLDADDLLHANKLQKQVPLAVASCADVVYCDWYCEAMHSAAGQLQSSSLTCQDSVILALSIVISTIAPLFPRSRLQEVGGWDESLPCAQDFDLNLRLACHGVQFLRLPEALITVRRRTDSVSADFQRVLKQLILVCCSAYRELNRIGGLTPDRAKAFAGALARYGRASLRHGRTDQAQKCFTEARKMHPGGGLEHAYQPGARTLCRLLGPVLTEVLVGYKRSLF